MIKTVKSGDMYHEIEVYNKMIYRTIKIIII